MDEMNRNEMKEERTLQEKRMDDGAEQDMLARGEAAQTQRKLTWDEQWAQLNGYDVEHTKPAKRRKADKRREAVEECAELFDEDDADSGELFDEDANVARFTEHSAALLTDFVLSWQPRVFLETLNAYGVSPTTAQCVLINTLAVRLTRVPVTVDVAGKNGVWLNLGI